MSEQGADPGVERLLAGYRTLPGVPDELLAPDGTLRPVWGDFIRHFAGLSEAEIPHRFARGDQYLRDAGVFYRQYATGSSTERAWPLAHIPVLIEEGEWGELATGLIQRAELLESIMADLYGEGRLVQDGHLPAGLVAGNPEWLRPLVGHRPRSGHFLHFIAFEIGRGPDGKWWVLGDRTQTPSGAGFALENRVAATRMYSELFAEAHVHRLAGFFRNFRDTLQQLRGDPSSRVGVLTPGPLNETYFEHAYIASYLGVALLEGEDLVVEQGEVKVRTVGGLQPVSVLWRRLDSAFADPLELDGSSRLGTPGLVQAIREGTITMVNALGSGVLETRAFLAFMPRLAKELLGTPLLLPNVATWWCGQEAERAHVREHAERMVMSPALSTGLPFAMEEVTPLKRRLEGSDPAEIAAWLEEDGARLVGQEAVTLSTTPAWVEGSLLPRPMMLRVFLARTGAGWEVMPGGFARIGRSAGGSAVAMQEGGSAADVWIVSPGAVDTVTMLPPETGPYLRIQPGVLPSRAADNLFWLGRYVERAEAMMRLLRAYHVHRAETGARGSPLIDLLVAQLEEMDVDPDEGLLALGRTLGQATASAGHVRDRFSHDGWMALQDLAGTARRMAETVVPGDDAARAMSVLLRKIAGFSGLVQENMYRFTGWRFLEIGGYLERGMAMAGTLARLADPGAADGALDLAVEIGDSVMTHRRRYAVSTNRATVIDLLALDTMNPRAILYQLTGIRDQVGYLPGAVVNGQLSPLSRAILRVHTRLAVLTPQEVETELLRSLQAEIGALSELLTESYMR